jgi:prepilin signal peptidase PulO-like enzyme (type II secretory pathway)
MKVISRSPPRTVFVCVLLLLAVSCVGVASEILPETMSEELSALCLVPVLVWISIADFRRREIPDGASLLVALIGAVLWSGDPEALFSNALVASVVALVLGVAGGAVWKQTGREWLGLGDVKLIGAGTMVVGWDALWIMLFLASVGGICATLVGRTWATEQNVPFGPFLAYAIFVTHLIAGPFP